MSRLCRRFRLWLRRAKRDITHSHGSAHQIAASVAVGTFVGFTPTVGFQMIIAAIITTALRIVRWPAIVMVYISNPFTIVPMYTSLYFFGVWLLSPFTSSFHPDRVVDKLQNVLSMPSEGTVWQRIYAASVNLLGLGWEVMAPLWLGCVVAGAVAAALMYYLTLRFVIGQRLVRAQHMAQRAKRRLERVREQQAREKADSEGDSSP